MVAVAVYHAFQQASMFLVDTRQTVFFYHKDAEAVAGIEHFGSHRVMGRTVGIAAELLQFLQSVHLQGIGNAGTYSGVVLVHVHTFQFQRLSVQEEALVASKRMSRIPVVVVLSIHQLAIADRLP